MKNLLLFDAQKGAVLSLLARSPASYALVVTHLGTDEMALRVAKVIAGLGEDETDSRVNDTAKYFLGWGSDFSHSKAAVAGAKF